MKRSMKRSKLLLSALLTGIMVFSQVPTGALAYAAESRDASARAATGSLTISKTVDGTGTPSADTEFEFTVVKGDVPASGQYSVDGGDLQAIPADGKIAPKAGQTAKLTLRSLPWQSSASLRVDVRFAKVNGKRPAVVSDCRYRYGSVTVRMY